MYALRMPSEWSKGLLRLSSASSLIGAAMWTYKSFAILLTGDQPDFWFELALFWFGTAILLLVYGLRDQLSRSFRLITALSWVSAVAGGVAAVAYIIEGDEGVFGPAALATMVSIVVIMFLIGGDIQSRRLLKRYNQGPRLLGWLFVISIPLGAVLSGINDRLLEVGLLAMVVGWVILALGTLPSANTN